MRGVTPSPSATFTSTPYSSTSACVKCSSRRLTAEVSNVATPLGAVPSPATAPARAEAGPGPVAAPRTRSALMRGWGSPASGNKAQCSGVRPAASVFWAAEGSCANNHLMRASFSEAAARCKGNSPAVFASATGTPRSPRPSASLWPPSAPRRPGGTRQSTCKRPSPVSGTRPRRTASSRTLRRRVRASSAFPISRASCKARKSGKPSSSRRCATPKCCFSNERQK
mmetsp:Transcript_150557/g.464606  ORF Transcript_150557/g.464606 Transcript_150557/m.464606 type:complete len:226 (+) Transcript_150557:315-992(+)